MSSSDLVYTKLARAVDALARRDAALTPRLRSMLILIDGKRSAEELSKLAGPEAPELLSQLLAMDMVSGERRTALRASSGPASSPAPLAAQGSIAEMADLRRAAVRRLTDLLGPVAEDLCLRVEATRTPQELASALQRAEDVLRDVGGAQMAANFSRDMHARGAH